VRGQALRLKYASIAVAGIIGWNLLIFDRKSYDD